VRLFPQTLDHETHRYYLRLFTPKNV